jgi:hypothetical protein
MRQRGHIEEERRDGVDRLCGPQISVQPVN